MVRNARGRNQSLCSAKRLAPNGLVAATFRGSRQQGPSLFPDNSVSLQALDTEDMHTEERDTEVKE
jgi:hypothetical protein